MIVQTKKAFQLGLTSKQLSNMKKIVIELDEVLSSLKEPLEQLEGELMRKVCLLLVFLVYLLRGEQKENA